MADERQSQRREEQASSHQNLRGEALELSSGSARSRRRGGRRRYRGLVGGGTLALILGLATLVGIRAAAPRVRELTIDDTGEAGPVLIARGDNLERLRWLWERRWLAELAEAGATVELAQLPELEADGSLRLPIRLRVGFDAETLPAPRLHGSSSEVSVDYRLQLRVAYVDYADTRATEGARQLFGELLDYLPADPRASFEPELDFRVLIASRDDGIGRSEWFASLQHTDMIVSGAYIYIRLEQAMRRDPSWRATLPDEREPLTVVACSARASDEYTYASAIVTPADGPLDRALEAQRARPLARQIGFFQPDELLHALDSLDEGQELHWFVPSKSSTSGYLMPCLDWRELLEDPRVALQPNTGEHDNNLAAAARMAGQVDEQGEAPWVLASIYEALLFDDEVDRHAWRMLWIKGGIPHGGVYVSNAISTRERELLVAGLDALIDDYRESGRAFPYFGGGISGLRPCPPNFDEFERRILASENLGYCAPELEHE